MYKIDINLKENEIYKILVFLIINFKNVQKSQMDPNLNPTFDTAQLCDFEQVTESL